MGLFDVFSKGGKYFGKAIEPKCEYCEWGKRSSDGNKVLCTKKGLVDAAYHCPKFQYSPLKRIPVKQLERVGWLEGDYEEKNFVEEAKKKAAEKAAAEKAEKEAAEKAEKEAAEKAAAEKAAAEKAAAEKAAAEKAAAEKAAAEKAAAEKAAAAKPEATAFQKPAPAPAFNKPAASPAPAPSFNKPAASPAPAKSAPVNNSLASLAAMAEKAGEYIPEPQDNPNAENPDAPKNDSNQTLSSM